MKEEMLQNDIKGIRYEQEEGTTGTAAGFVTEPEVGPSPTEDVIDLNCSYNRPLRPVDVCGSV